MQPSYNYPLGSKKYTPLFLEIFQVGRTGTIVVNTLHNTNNFLTYHYGLTSISNNLEFALMRWVSSYSPLTQANWYTQVIISKNAMPSNGNVTDVKDIMNLMLNRILLVIMEHINFTTTITICGKYRRNMYPNSGHKDVVEIYLSEVILQSRVCYSLDQKLVPNTFSWGI